MDKIKKWLYKILKVSYRDNNVFIRNAKNSKVIINGEIIFDNTKTSNFKGWFTTNNQVNNYNKDE